MAETTRRLAAVAFADVVDWSRLIERSDVETLRAWKLLRSEVIEPTIHAHQGRLLEVAGDSVLVEFPSAVAAVSWAMELQKQSRTRRNSESVTLKLRIGINVEDVIVDGDKLVGDGVNIASRIHQLGGADEIIVTAAVREYVANKLAVAFSDLGMRSLKNISRRIQVYRVEEARSAARGGERAAEPGVPEPAYRDSHSDQAVRTILAVEAVGPAGESEHSNRSAASRWQELVDDLTNNVLPLHGGRVLRSMDRALLLGFSRVPQATKAAFDIQRMCESTHAGTPLRLSLRMGMQLGELVADEQEVYGGEASLAARLTTLAGPGEIVVSAGVRDQLTPVLDGDIEDLGDCYLKALAHPVRAYRVGPPGPQPVIEASAATDELRPTIGVIPFSARSGGVEHQVLGEVLADEVISALSRTADMNVISRLSTTAFRGREATLEEMSAHLHADYIVSGAYHVTSGGFTLVAELAQAKSRRVVWMKDVKGKIADLVSGESEVIDRLVTDVSTAITTRELQKAQMQALPTLESYSLLIGAISLMHRLSQRDFERARQLLEALIARAPKRAVPHAWLAKWHVLRVWQGWSAEPAADARLALECTQRALDSDQHCSLALVIDGMVHTNLLKQLDAAQESYELALRANPNDSLGWLLQGTLHAFKGEGKQALSASKRALALSPLDPMRYFYDSLSATAALAARRYDLAVDRARRSLRANRTHASTLRALAIAQWELGQQDEARKTVAELMKVEPGLTIRNYLERSPSSAYETGTIWSRALHGAGVPM